MIFRNTKEIDTIPEIELEVMGVQQFVSEIHNCKKDCTTILKFIP